MNDVEFRFCLRAPWDLKNTNGQFVCKPCCAQINSFISLISATGTKNYFTK